MGMQTLGPDRIQAPREFLVIGYGNELRGDDALGPKLAEAIEALHLPGVRVLRLHQLTPELADPISTADAVAFFDASTEEGDEVQVRSLEPATTPEVRGHFADPAALLGLARELFGKAPPGWWITIPAECFHFGAPLSPRAEAGRSEALRQFKELWARWSNARASEKI